MTETNKIPGSRVAAVHEALDIIKGMSPKDRREYEKLAGTTDTVALAARLVQARELVSDNNEQARQGADDEAKQLWEVANGRGKKSGS